MASAAGKQDGAKSHARRDLLLEIQANVQKKWAEAKIFEADAAAELPKDGEKYFGNFPYPYMNGLLHLGHAFTLSKVEFASAYHRLRGKNVLFPFGFHCTGMPIKACADKLAREMEKFGFPPQFPATAAEIDGPAPAASATEAADAAAAMEAEKQEQQQAGEAKDPTKFKGKKSKAAAKTGTAKYQWEIMRSMGLSDDEIKPFSDPQHWLSYFPPLAKADLEYFGLGVDWRRSFITTDTNPFYDSFAQWHLQTLRDRGKVVKDRRYTIFSPLDGQPCADHDRASGEGVLPQEYTLIKMEVLPPFSGKLAPLAGRRVFLAAATLRPETMYGQTNAWVLPHGEYGAFEISPDNSDVFIVTRRSAINLSHQFMSKEPGKPSCLLELTGQDLIGVPLSSPLTTHKAIYALPMLTILTDKGTGIVTSVPSDAPDDFMALQDLKNKPALRAKFGVKDEWVLPFSVIPIINIPGFGDAAAVTVCTELKIQSQNDKEKLAEAKRQTYLKGFTDGVMLVGEHKGRKVQDAKPIIRKELIDAGLAVPYSEPEKRVVSRSGDDCVVALTDQWYLTYGEKEWRELSDQCLQSMQLYSTETRRGFEHTLGWLDRWACSRSFGLGSRIPWDPQFLIESLSDSTIYMAYYTVAHLLQGGDIFGQHGLVDPSLLTREVWDYLFLDGPLPNGAIPKEILEKARSEFEYWYPFDLRVSGKDLINNHLAFAIYNHTAMFDQSKWPRGFRCNGHLLLNSEKMSKSTGNFKTVRQAIDEFSSDATRFALADAGDTVDDANFVEDTANAAILRLTKEMTWMEEVLASSSSLRTGPPSAFSFADRVFANEMDIAVERTTSNFESLMFRDGLKTGFFDLQLARDEYRLACGPSGMHHDLLMRFMETQTLLVMPICPHYGEHVWTSILKKPGFGIKAGWPHHSTPDLTLQAANNYLQDTIVELRKLITKQQQLLLNPKGGGKKKGAAAAPAASEEGAKKPTISACHVFVAEKYGGWQETCLNILRDNFDVSSKNFSDDATIAAALKASPVAQDPGFKKLMGMCLGFMRFRKDAATKQGAQALDVRLPFDEAMVLRSNEELIRRQLGLEQFSVYLSTDEAAVSAEDTKDAARIASAVPGTPVAVFRVGV